MMERFSILLLLLGIFLIGIPSSSGVSPSCMMVYDEGGAPAVFESPKCPQWFLSAGSHQNQIPNCQFATLQGHRDYQEDRVVCDLNMKIPFIGENGLKDIEVGIAAIFDGHGGNQASEMASKLFLDYFRLHVVFNAYKLENGSSEGALSATSDESMQFEILKDALVKAILDIDSIFTQEALRNKYDAGSTATVVLMANGSILVANVGDSKALLLRFTEEDERHLTPHLSAIELTKDHHPDRDDERARIEGAGGFVIFWGVPRVNGILAVSRAIGDVSLKRYGVVAVPELTGWLPLTTRDKYLVVSSDGIFESLNAEYVSHLITSWCSDSYSSSLTEHIVNTAYRKGSGDNLSVILIPLRPDGSYETCKQNMATKL